MESDSTFIGSVQDVNGISISVQISENVKPGLSFINGNGYRLGQIGSFVKIPIGYVELYGVVSQVGASAAPEITKSELMGNRWLKIQLIGECSRADRFQRGVSQYPTVGDEVHFVSEKDLRKIYGQTDLGYFVKVGAIVGADSIPALLDVNKLITRHCAVVGTTGSGKSTTVASLLLALSKKEKYPASRILVFDIHGEYAKSFKGSANVFRVNANPTAGESELSIPFWALSFQELSEICFGKEVDDKIKHFLMEKIIEEKKKSLNLYPRAGCILDNLDVDTPIPYSINKLWHELYGKCYSTFYNVTGADKNDPVSWAYVQENGVDIVGDIDMGLPPRFKPVDVSKDTTVKINHTSLLSSYSGIGNHLDALGSKLRIPRYNFLFRPSEFLPDHDGRVNLDLDSLLKQWIGSKHPITILDLSGIPSEVMRTIVGAISRILYDALFWGRNSSQGGKQRPLLLVMEEAHNYLKDSKSNFASDAVQKIVKEGRKYGIGAMIVSQRPSELNSTVLSQCGTFIALRLTNTQDRGHVSSALPDSLEGLTSMLPSLRTGEAIILGEAVKLPMRALITPPRKDQRPDSEDPIVFDPYDPEVSFNVGGWGIPMEPETDYSSILESWRKQNSKINPKE